MNRAAALLAAIVLAVSPMAALAVEGRAQVAGTVAPLEKGRVQVKRADGKTTSVTLSSSTVFTSANPKAKASARTSSPVSGGRSRSRRGRPGSRPRR